MLKRRDIVRLYAVKPLSLNSCQFSVFSCPDSRERRERLYREAPKTTKEKVLGTDNWPALKRFALLKVFRFDTTALRRVSNHGRR